MSDSSTKKKVHSFYCLVGRITTHPPQHQLLVGMCVAKQKHFHLMHSVGFRKPLIRNHFMTSIEHQTGIPSTHFIQVSLFLTSVNASLWGGNLVKTKAALAAHLRCTLPYFRYYWQFHVQSWNNTLIWSQGKNVPVSNYTCSSRAYLFGTLQITSRDSSMVHIASNVRQLMKRGVPSGWPQFWNWRMENPGIRWILDLGYHFVNYINV